MTASAGNSISHVTDVDADSNARAYAWSLLGAMLTRPVTPEILDSLKNLPTAPDQAAGAAGSDSGSNMGMSWLALRSAANNVLQQGTQPPGTQSAVPNTIVEEYNALFIGVGRGELVPYGSWYMTGFLMERPLADLRTDLKRLGFERNPDVKEPEDHAGAISEIMAMLITDQTVPDKAQMTFFKRHIDPWMQQFFHDLASARRASFYRAVGQFGAQFVETEREYLAL